MSTSQKPELPNTDTNAALQDLLLQNEYFGELEPTAETGELSSQADCAGSQIYGDGDPGRVSDGFSNSAEGLCAVESTVFGYWNHNA
jgi:hypothetical protein